MENHLLTNSTDFPTSIVLVTVRSRPKHHGVAPVAAGSLHRYRRGSASPGFRFGFRTLRFRTEFWLNDTDHHVPRDRCRELLLVIVLRSFRAHRQHQR